MASCYLCGCSLRTGEGVRRKVLVGESSRVYFTKRGGGSYGRSYALRTICPYCANTMDERNRSIGKKLPISLVIAVFGIYMAIKHDGEFHSAFGAILYFFSLFGGMGIVAYGLLSLIDTSEAKSADTSYLNNFRSDDDRPVKPQSYQSNRAKPEKYLRDYKAEHIPPKQGAVSTQQDIGSTTYDADHGINTLPPMVIKAMEADFLRQADTLEQKRGLKILFNAIKHNKGLGVETTEKFIRAIIGYSMINPAEAEEYVMLLGRREDEDVDVWYSRASILLPFELNCEDGTAWLKVAYKMAYLLEVDLYFGFDEAEESELKAAVLTEIEQEGWKLAL